MDGGRRVLRSLTVLLTAPLSLAFARPNNGAIPAATLPGSAPRPRSRRAQRRPVGSRIAERLNAIIVHPFVTSLFIFGFLSGAFAYGAVRSGAYDTFIDEVGTPGDLLARLVGLGIDSVTISGISELKENEILAYAGVKARNSLPYLDPISMRERLKLVPLIKDAEVRKLYPSRLAISIIERQPFALWQKDGKISIVSSDGMPIDTMHDDKYAALPLIVGEGANERLDEYVRILAASGDLSTKIKAGALISRRRWTLLTTDGIELKLPEQNPESAMTRLVRLQKDDRLLDKDIVSVDLRIPGRLLVRLTDESANQRIEATARKTKGKV